jgi:hypothetical protein
MSPRKWKGAKVCDGIATASKIPSRKILQPAKFGDWWSEGRTSKICPPMQKLGWTKGKGKAGTKVRQEFAANKIWQKNTKL